MAVFGPSAEAARYTLLHSFGNVDDGSNPHGSLISDPAGNFYGTTSLGGTANAGTVYRIGPDGNETVLYSFQGGDDGETPIEGLYMDAAGNLFGTTGGGGTARTGTVFKLTSDGTKTTLYSFQGGSDGANPRSQLIGDQFGNLYGTTSEGGAFNAGTVFKLSPGGVKTILHTFNFSDGQYPVGGLYRDSNGNFYGTTSGGGVRHRGTVYKLAPDLTETVLHSFLGRKDGCGPAAGVVADQAGNLYGTTPYCGPHKVGIIFKVAADGTESTLYALKGAKDGRYPAGPPTLDSAGNLYATTGEGGEMNGGTIFRLESDGKTKVLHAFDSQGFNNDPSAVSFDQRGRLYGTTYVGGDSGAGSFYELKLH